MDKHTMRAATTAAAAAATVTELTPETVVVGWEQNRRGADEIDVITVIIHSGIPPRKYI